MTSLFLKGNNNRQSFEKCCTKYDVGIKVISKFSLQVTGTISPLTGVKGGKRKLECRDIIEFVHLLFLTWKRCSVAREVVA